MCALPASPLEFVALEGDPASAIARVPSGAGVGQILGPGGRNLLLAPASNLRRWAAAHLGQGGAPPPGRRPRTDLSGVATAIGWTRTGSAFGQRLLYERLLAPLVPVSERRDLKPPAFLHLEPDERFPRVTVREKGETAAFGPFRSHRAAEKARDAVNRLFGLRACDDSFEPDPALDLGRGCLYAQVRSCSAPCLERVSEADYRGIAARAAAWLADPSTRGNAPDAVPATVAAVGDARAVVLGVGRREVELYPAWQGRVLEGSAVSALPGDLEAAVAALEWPPTRVPSDWPWLSSWLQSPRGRGSYVAAKDPADRQGLMEAIRAALPSRFAGSSADGNVEASKGGQ